MTEEQKMQVRTLRQQGLGYQAIGTILNLSRDSVRSYCKNHGMHGVATLVKLNTQEKIKNGEACGYCAGPLKQNTIGRPKKFCSEKCRREYWKRHRNEGQRSVEATYIYECPYCHKIFEAYGNKHRKYCCHAHYVLDRYGEPLGKENLNAISTADDIAHIGA